MLAATIALYLPLSEPVKWARLFYLLSRFGSRKQICFGDLRPPNPAKVEAVFKAICSSFQANYSRLLPLFWETLSFVIKACESFNTHEEK